MTEVLTILFWAVLAFAAMDYTLARVTLRDPLRAIVAAVFAVLFVLFTQEVFGVV